MILLSETSQVVSRQFTDRFFDHFTDRALGIRAEEADLLLFFALDIDSSPRPKFGSSPCPIFITWMWNKESERNRVRKSQRVRERERERKRERKKWIPELGWGSIFSHPSEYFSLFFPIISYLIVSHWMMSSSSTPWSSTRKKPDSKNHFSW